VQNPLNGQKTCTAGKIGRDWPHIATSQPLSENNDLVNRETHLLADQVDAQFPGCPIQEQCGQLVHFYNTATTRLGAEQESSDAAYYRSGGAGPDRDEVEASGPRSEAWHDTGSIEALENNLSCYSDKRFGVREVSVQILGHDLIFSHLRNPNPAYGSSELPKFGLDGRSSAVLDAL
jgi:hypothetical protein